MYSSVFCSSYKSLKKSKQRINYSIRFIVDLSTGSRLTFKSKIGFEIPSLRRSLLLFFANETLIGAGLKSQQSCKKYKLRTTQQNKPYVGFLFVTNISTIKTVTKPTQLIKTKISRSESNLKII